MAHHVTARRFLSADAPSPAAGDGAGAWRWLPVVTAALVWVGLLGLTLVPEWRTAVRACFPWMVDPLFHDWEVLRRGWATSLAGEDPLSAAGQPFNHPRLVLAVAEFGVWIPIPAAGVVTAAVGLGTFVWVLWPKTRGQAVLAAGLLVSLPVLLLVERGSLDAWAFCLVAAGMVALTAEPLRWPGLAGGTVALLAAMLLKLFPAVIFPAAALFWRGPRRVVSAAGFAVWVVWLVTSVDEVALILEKSTRVFEPAYGRIVGIARYYAEVMAPRSRESGGSAAFGLLLDASFVVGLAGFVAAAALGWRWRERFASLAASQRDRALYWSGALMYGGTFFLGNNWSDRLVFLALCIPLLWRATGLRVVRKWGGAGLVGITLLFASPMRLPFSLFLAQQAVAWLLAWLLFGMAVAFLAASKDADR